MNLIVDVILKTIKYYENMKQPNTRNTKLGMLDFKSCRSLSYVCEI